MQGDRKKSIEFEHVSEKKFLACVFKKLFKVVFIRKIDQSRGLATIKMTKQRETED